MAWFGEGLSSLKGQLSNFAKGVLVEEEEQNTQTSEGTSNVPESFHSHLGRETTGEGSGWSEAEEDTFIGQDVGVVKDSENKTPVQASLPGTSAQSAKSNVEKEMAAMIPKGIAQFFHQIGVPSSEQKRPNTIDQEVQTDSSFTVSNEEIIQTTLREQNAQLFSEVESLRRAVRDLESQIASSQDENANLSTGLEELDIQHQEAIERILNVKEETQKELEQIKEQFQLRNDEYRSLFETNEGLRKELELAHLEHMGCETLAQENAHLRERIGELVKTELPAISEQSAAEEHVRSLEAEIAALRESRDNLERENASLLSQVRQRDANLRQVDAKLEEVTKEKEIKEREMTQIVFESNSLREELKNNSDRVDNLEKIVTSTQEENSSLQSKLEEALTEIDSLKTNLEASKRETNLAKDESETLKAELESLKEELGGGEAKALRDCKDLEISRKELQEAKSKIESLHENVSSLDKNLSESMAENERYKSEFEIERQSMQNELDVLRDIQRKYDIQKDIFKEKECELKRQLATAENELSALNYQLNQAEKEVNDVKHQLSKIQQENESLTSRVETLNEKNEEILRYQRILEDQKSENKKLQEIINTLKGGSNALSEERSQSPTVDVLKSEIDNYKRAMQALESKFVEYFPLKEKENLGSENASLLEQINNLEDLLNNLITQKEMISNEKKGLEEGFKKLVDENEKFKEEKSNLDKVSGTLLSEISTLTSRNGDLMGQVEKLETTLSDLMIEKNNLIENLKTANDFNDTCVEQLNCYGGVEGALQKLSQYEEQQRSLTHQVDHFKDELKEAYEERTKLSSDLSTESTEKKQLLEQIEILRRELDNIVILKQEVENLKHSLQMKSVENISLQKEIKRLNNALSVQLNNNESLYKEKVELIQKCEQLHVQIQGKMANMEEIEKVKTKEVESLKQEIETLKTQLEYASQLLQNVERQDGEGQPSGETNSQKASTEIQEEVTRLSTALLKEQTDCKLLKNQLEDTKEKLEKAENQLRTLKIHLVEIQDSYSSELSAADEKLRETQTQLIAAEERARTSSTAYTSASIRANQQVEALREQLRLLTEHKEKLEQQLSQAEDAALKQSASVTRLQAVLHQFHVDKQKDIDFETERIRRDLKASEKKNEELLSEMKILQEQLAEARKGLAAGQKLSEELLKQSEVINQLKSEIFELKEKLRMKEEKMNDLNSDNKVDRTLMKNLLVGYVTSPMDSKPKVLGVISQVLSLSKEERQKVGLEPGGRQPTLSEAFIKFLQSESQPRPEVILPLPVPSERPPSRKSSLLTPEVPVLPHFPVGRNPGSILKDVLQERRPE